MAHKTGSDNVVTSDVGIITLPNRGEHVAIAVFIKNSDKPMSEQERAIAEVARLVYDFFTFQS